MCFSGNNLLLALWYYFCWEGEEYTSLCPYIYFKQFTFLSCWKQILKIDFGFEVDFYLIYVCSTNQHLIWCQKNSSVAGDNIKKTGNDEEFQPNTYYANILHNNKLEESWEQTCSNIIIHNSVLSGTLFLLQTISPS